MSTIIKCTEKKNILVIKGASEIVLDSCQYYLNPKDETIFIDAAFRETLVEAITEMANSALRTLCVAFKYLQKNEDIKTKDSRGIFQVEKNDLVLFALLGIKDILRKEVPDAVSACKRAGIKVRMVTGDNKMTATAIAKECGIICNDSPNSLVMEGPEFMEAIGGVVCKLHRTEKCECLQSKDLAKKEGKSNRVDTIANASVFNEIYPNLDVLARSRPEDKYALVLGLTERGHVVAATGDGTNDAPALKKADVGFAMGIAGTEVCRESSDIVLLDDNFSSIVKAVMWGRNVYDSIRKFLQFQLTVNVVAVLCTLVGAVIIKQAIFSPIQMLWINLIMDSLASLALATEVPTEKLLLRKPHKRSDYIISRTMFKHVIGQSILQFIIILILVFKGDDFLPEYQDSNDGTPNRVLKYNLAKYTQGKLIVRSGRIFNYGEGQDYGDNHKSFPSRHFTYIFNAFVWMQIVNFINSRKIFDEFNVFQGILKNKLFLFIVGAIIFLQFLIVSFTGIAFGCYIQKQGLGGLTIQQWLICIAFSLLGLIWSLFLKLIPESLCFQYGLKQVNPCKSTSILDIRKKDRAATIKYTMAIVRAGTMKTHGSKKSK